MAIRIGIITSPTILELFRMAEDSMRQICEIEFLPYTTTLELERIFREKAHLFDGLLFSAPFPYDYIVQNVSPIYKSYRCLSLSNGDFYRVFAQLMAQRPELDMRRVYFDSTNDLTPFTDVFPADYSPMYTVSKKPPEEYNRDFYAWIWENYKKMWDDGKIDLVVTFAGNLCHRFEEEGIPYVLLLPAPETIMECFTDLVNEIRERMLTESLVASCVIRIDGDAPSEEDYDQLEKMLSCFNHDQNMSFVLRRDGDSFDMVTSNKVMQTLTADSSTCLLTSFLKERLPYRTIIGWGLGFDIVAAHRNAVKAHRESRRDVHHYTYLVNEKNEMIGPLAGSHSATHVLQPSSRIQQLAAALGIAPQNLQKLEALKVSKQMDEFSSSDLVYYLGITPRSAARILKKLSECGGATRVRSAQLSGRGRRSVIYRIDLERINL